MATQDRPIVPGSPTSVAGLGKSETWLKDWLAEAPERVGIGKVSILDHEPVQDEDGNLAFLASDEERYFSVNVRLGEFDASHGFHVLDSWARNRVRHPDKTHVAVLVAERATGRYHTALAALADLLPLVVVELQAWQGKSEVIVAPRIALASRDLELFSTPAETAAEQVATDTPAGKGANGSTAPAHEAKDGEPEATIDDPWKLPKRDADALAVSGNGS